MTIPGGYVANDVLTAANMNLLPAGKVGYAAVTANQTGITTIVDVTSLTVTWTAVSSRRYRTSWYFAASTSAGAEYAEVRCTDGAGTQKGVSVSPVLSTVYEQSTSGSVTETGLSGSITRKLQVRRLAGVGNVSINASATNPAYILVEDLGPA